MSAGPGGNTSSPKDCAVCNHSGKVSQCPGCGGLLGLKQWPPCTICHGVIGVGDPPPPGVPLLDQIEATEPSQLPTDQLTQRITDNAAIYDDTV